MRNVQLIVFGLSCLIVDLLGFCSPSLSEYQSLVMFKRIYFGSCKNCWSNYVHSFCICGHAHRIFFFLILHVGGELKEIGKDIFRLKVHKNESWFYDLEKIWVLSSLKIG